MLDRLVLLLIVVALVLMALGSKAANRRFPVPEQVLADASAGDPTRGEHLSRILACRECHGARLQGREMIDAPPFRVVAANLTTGHGGAGRVFGPRDWDRALAGAGLFPLDTAVTDPSTPRLAEAPSAAPTAVYGAYLAKTICMESHGEDLRGAPPVEPGAPPGPSLANASRRSLSEFSIALREGETPVGAIMDPQYMPWQAFSSCSDLEVEALYRHLETSLP